MCANGSLPMLDIHQEGTPQFAEALARLEQRGELDAREVEDAVRAILDDVRREGDGAVRRHVERFEGRTPARLLVRDYGGEAALGRLSAPARDALGFAAGRIRAFHERQRDTGFFFTDADGVTLGTRVRPVRRAGVYAPGGKARYPSSVLMAAIPAAVAGVGEIVLATPLQGDGSDDSVLAAAHLAGVSAIVDAGGAQAIAAMAYGTESIARVDKIVGPGNRYVACAKRLVYGAVSIDSIAGPSEILVLADGSARPEVVAADLLSQAEHDEAAYAVLACTDHSFALAVRAAVEAQLAELPREAIARRSLTERGAIFVVSGRPELSALADRVAAEHLSLQVEDAEALLDTIGSAGAAFLGPLTPEAAGDYVAGPSHVLPTGGAVRFGAPLGVYDFVTRTSLIRYSATALGKHADAIVTLARLEGLEAHARAVTVRRG